MTDSIIIPLSILAYLTTTLILSILFFVWFLKLRNLRSRFSGVIDAEKEEALIRAKTRSAFEIQKQKILHEQEAMRKLKSDYKIKFSRLKDLERALVPLEDISDLQDIGFFEPKFQLTDHAAYVVAIQKIRDQQKDFVRSKKAVSCRGDWEVGGSKREGKKMVDRATRLSLRAFNNECNVLISKVTWKNLSQIIERINRASEALNKLNESIELKITRGYVKLKAREAELVSEDKIKHEDEKEQLREQRAAEREEAKARREIEAEMKRQQAEEDAKAKDLVDIKKRLLTASPEHKEALEAEMVELEEAILTATKEKGRLLSMAEHTRIGHLYVISNNGAFGERLVKIGMTRRLDPMDRIKELGDASVPFPFDVHAMVFSEDAPKLERDLHNVFDEFRTNKINRRKEFFEIPLEMVKSELEKRFPGVAFEFNAPSMEYLASKAQLVKDESTALKSSEFESSLD